MYSRWWSDVRTEWSESLIFSVNTRGIKKTERHCCLARSKFQRPRVRLLLTPPPPPITTPLVLSTGKSVSVLHTTRVRFARFLMNRVFFFYFLFFFRSWRQYRNTTWVTVIFLAPMPAEAANTVNPLAVVFACGCVGTCVCLVENIRLYMCIKNARLHAGSSHGQYTTRRVPYCIGGRTYMNCKVRVEVYI